ncbi:MAG: RNA-directed DNA polymerase [Bacteroidia bacterium]|nr:RNA-directed DNA polymerase [Bacteroidia bacterium]
MTIPITELTPSKVRELLLRGEWYFEPELPDYFRFGDVLQELNLRWGQDSESAVDYQRAARHTGVNHVIYGNKDGRYAWRAYQLIHPLLYVSLVRLLTEDEHWERIRSLLKEKPPEIECHSIPVVSNERNKQAADQIVNWWENVELHSMELSLEYVHIFHADISNFYSSIYTHSIPWAIHGQEDAKKRRNDKELLGNKIDKYLQAMNYGQTNGIPVGSILSDILAEIVLAYADKMLYDEISNQTKAMKIDYRILRYRDDYRIFTNSPRDGEIILKSLTSVLANLGLRLNPQKTQSDSDVLKSSTKPDKVEWLMKNFRRKSLLHSVMAIYYHSLSYPNSGSVVRALAEVNRRLKRYRSRNPNLVPAIIALLAGIVVSSPRSTPVAISLLSKVLHGLGNREKAQELIRRFSKRVAQIPNAGLIEIWLQRLTLPYFGAEYSIYTEKLCQVVANALNTTSPKRKEEINSLWNSEWVEDKRFLAEFCGIVHEKLIDTQRIRSLSEVVRDEEVDIFLGDYKL